MAASRALLRWAWRTTRREWRQQLIVSVLLIAAMTVAVTSNLLAVNVAAPEKTYQYSDSIDWFQLSDSKGDESAGIASATVGDQLHQVDASGLSPLAKIVEEPTAAATADGLLMLRNQTTPPGELSTRLSLLEGTWPTAPNEAAITKSVGAQLDAELNEVVVVGDSTFTITAFVEDPSRLSSQFMLVDESAISDPMSALLLFDRNQSVREVVPGLTGDGYTVFGPTPKEEAALISAFATSFALLITALMSISGFAVLARRRLRQIGMLGSIGAEPSHIQRGLLFHGLAIGTVAAVVGGILGVLLTTAAVPFLDSVVDRRVDLSLPLTAIVPPFVAMVAFSAAAAWWPARQFARLSSVDALASRVPHADRVQRWAPRVGLVCVVLGVASVFVGGVAKQNVPQVVGMILAVVGVLLVSPLVVSLLAKIGSKSVLPVWLASRVAQRNNTRSAISLAAVTLTVAVPLTVVVLTASYDKRSVPDMADDMAFIEGRSISEAQVGAVALATPGATSVPVKSAWELIVSRPGDAEGLFVGLPHVVGEPALMDALGLDSSVWERADVLVFDDLGGHVSVHRDDAGPDALASLEEPEVRFLQVDVSRAGGQVKAVVSPAFIEEVDVSLTTDKWLLVNPTSITLDQQIDLQQRAQGFDGWVTGPRFGDDSAPTRLIAVLVALALTGTVLALTIALNRAEDTQRFRTMAAIGASSSTNRSVAAATAALFALGGVVLGTGMALLALFADATSTGTSFGAAFALPIASFLAIFFGAVAFAAGLAWLTERQPRSLRTVSQ